MVGGVTVVIVSANVLLPPGPVAVQIQVDGLSTHAALAILGAAVPFTVGMTALPVNPPVLDVQLYDIDVAFVELQVVVKVCPATSGLGVRDILMVGGGA